MLSSAIIVFREVFEIVLILGVVMAATRGIAGRVGALTLGLLGGLAGAGLIAFFAEQISNFAEGMGQEYFNALILFVAAGFIGWTVLWMKRHGTIIRAQFKQVGQDVADGKTPILVLSAIIALAVWREGAEIVLFSYGMLAGGSTMTDVLSGAGLGLAGGLTLGGLLYAGMIRLPLGLFFRVTTTLLVLLVAGMVSQGIGYLVSAGLFDGLSAVAWDTSRIIPESNLFGETLKVLVGYTARPTLVQLMFYGLTLAALIISLRWMDRRSFRASPAGVAVVLILSGVMGFAPAAHANKTVKSPYVEQGEFELESKTGYDIDGDENTDGAWKEVLGAGYGVTDFWFTEAEVEFARAGRQGADPETKALKWENKFQLTQPGEFFVDVGAAAEYVYNTAGDADKVEGKLLLGKQLEKVNLLANAIVKREVGSEASDENEYEFSWSASYRYAPNFEPGLEMYNEVGNFEGDFDEQTHRIGPVAYGDLGGGIKYDAGVLFGVSESAPDATLKLILEYETHF